MNMSKEVKSIGKDIGWALEQSIKFDKKYLIVLILNAIVLSVSPVITLIITQELVNYIQRGNRNVSKGLCILALLILLEVLIELLTNCFAMSIQNSEIRFNSFLHDKILRKIGKFDCKKLEQSETYDLINRVKYDDSNSVVDMIKAFFLILSSLVSFFSYTVIIAKYNSLIIIVITALPILQLVLKKRINCIEFNVRKRNTERRRKINYIFELLTNASNFKELKMYQLLDYFANVSESEQNCYDKEIVEVNKRKVRLYSVFLLFQYAIDFIIIAYLLEETITGRLLIGSFLLYNSSIKACGECLFELFSNMSDIHKQSIYLSEFKAFFELEEERCNRFSKKIESIEKITFKNVSYSYNGVKVLHNISFEIDTNDTVFLLGKNGSGKSTLIKIIMGLYTDYNGVITVNGINLKDVDMDSYRRCISPLLQDYIKYETTIGGNVRYAELGRDFNISKILDDFCLMELKDFENEKLGYQFNEGRELSIGQWQKLAIARTVSRNANLYVFDEPNSALDVITEMQIFKKIKSETVGKMCIVIMHRFRNIIDDNAKIIVLKEGRLVEKGRVDELKRNNGEFRSLLNAQ